MAVEPGVACLTPHTRSFQKSRNHTAHQALKKLAQQETSIQVRQFPQVNLYGMLPTALGCAVLAQDPRQLQQSGRTKSLHRALRIGRADMYLAVAIHSAEGVTLHVSRAPRMS